jgi:hypothetical protein
MKRWAGNVRHARTLDGRERFEHCSRTFCLEASPNPEDEQLFGAGVTSMNSNDKYSFRKIELNSAVANKIQWDAPLFLHAVPQLGHFTDQGDWAAAIR